MPNKQVAIKSTRKGANAEPTDSKAVSSKAPKVFDLTDPRRFWAMEFIAERGFLTEKQSEGFATTFTALGWKEIVKHRKDFVVPLVRDFYAGIPEPIDGKKATYSMVRGEKVDFDLRTINEWYRLGYHGKAIENKVKRFGKSEMEDMKEKVCVEEAVWEKFGSEYRLLKAHLCDEAKMWFNFMKHSLIPTSHTTNVEKERLIVLDAIMAGD